MSEQKFELSTSFLLEDELQDILWDYGPECILACLWAKAIMIRRGGELYDKDIPRIANNCRADERLVEMALSDCHLFEYEEGMYWLKYDNEQNRDSLTTLPYNEYLKSNYWKNVAQTVKRNAGYKCSKCGSNKRLEVHHLTYEHKGEEMDYLEDLVCLCHDCHAKLHDKQ